MTRRWSLPIFAMCTSCYMEIFSIMESSDEINSRKLTMGLLAVFMSMAEKREGY